MSRAQRPVLPCEACGRPSGRILRNALVTTRTGGTYREPITCADGSCDLRIPCPRPGHGGAMTFKVALDAGGGCCHCDGRCSSFAAHDCNRSGRDACDDCKRTNKEVRAAGGELRDRWLAAIRREGEQMPRLCTPCFDVRRENRPREERACEGGCGQKVLRVRSLKYQGWCSACRSVLAVLEARQGRVADLIRRTEVDDSERLVAWLDRIARVTLHVAGVRGYRPELAEAAE